MVLKMENGVVLRIFNSVQVEENIHVVKNVTFITRIPKIGVLKMENGVPFHILVKNQQKTQLRPLPPQQLLPRNQQLPLLQLLPLRREQLPPPQLLVKGEPRPLPPLPPRLIQAQQNVLVHLNHVVDLDIRVLQLAVKLDIIVQEEIIIIINVFQILLPLPLPQPLQLQLLKEEPRLRLQPPLKIEEEPPRPRRQQLLQLLQLQDVLKPMVAVMVMVSLQTYQNVVKKDITVIPEGINVNPIIIHNQDHSHSHNHSQDLNHNHLMDGKFHQVVIGKNKYINK